MEIERPRGGDGDTATAVLIIGAGPAGLAVAAQLRERNIPFLICDKGRAGESWRRMPAGLKLVSPWKTNWLSPRDAHRHDANAQLARGEFLKYLEEFAAANRLAIRAHCAVNRVSRIGARFRAETSRGTIECDFVVNSTGYFAAPVRPDIPGADTSSIPQLHCADYHSPDRLNTLLRRPGPVLVVGKRLSAGQMLVELVDAGFQVALSHRTPIRFGCSDRLWPLVYRHFAIFETVRLKLLRRREPAIDVPMPGGRARELIESGTVPTFPTITRFDREVVEFEDGRQLPAALVLYATGFQPALRHLAPLQLRSFTHHGVPVCENMESVEVPNLFFLGLELLRNFQSRFLRGIRHDAVELAGIIEKKLALSHAAVATANPLPRSKGVLQRARGLSRTAMYYLRVPVTWAALTVHNSWGILNVLDLIWLRPMRGGLIDHRHPFCTGRDAVTGDPVWHRNLVFKTPRREVWPNTAVAPEADDEILRKVGDHLRKQVLMAAAAPGALGGHPAPMPPGILYIHGGVHYNGAWLLFNDFREAIRHFSDPRFAAEFRRLVREEKREPVTLFRDRDYDRDEFAHFVCFMRTLFPWFSNCNGPKKFVLWGNPSPYAAVNTITGNWIRDTRALKTETGRRHVARPPIARAYFRDGPYFGDRDTARWPERFLAALTHRRIAWRGERENLYFVDKRKIRRGFRFGPKPLPTAWERLARFFRRRTPAATAGAQSETGLIETRPTTLVG